MTKTPLFLFVLYLSFHMPFLGGSEARADRVEARARFLESTSQRDIEKQSFRYKLITSRAYGLYLEALLPEKGNPYQHILNSFNAYNLQTFKAAQRSSASFMNTQNWLPFTDGEVVGGGILKNDLQKRAAVVYLARWMASSRVLDFILEKYSRDILVGPIDKYLSLAGLQQFRTGLVALRWMRSEYQKRWLGQAFLRGYLVTEERVAYLRLANQFADSMRPHLHLVAHRENSDAIRDFFGQIQQIANRVSRNPQKFSEQLPKIQSTIAAITAPTSSKFRFVHRALNSVDLPESGDIDGTENSFEAVFRLETCFDMILAIFSLVETWK